MNTIPNTGPINISSNNLENVNQNQINRTIQTNAPVSSRAVSAMDMNISESKNTNDSINSKIDNVQNNNSKSKNTLNSINQNTVNNSSSSLLNSSQLNYRKDSRSEKPVIQIENKESGKVIYQIPPEVSLRIAEVLDKVKGQVVDKNI
jgi:flagellar protein FlaG